MTRLKRLSTAIAGGFVGLLLHCGVGHTQTNPIVFVTQVPIPEDFATVNAVFGNHRASVAESGRGGDLWIRYPNGTLKNLTQAAGFGKVGLQTGSGIAVRDPAVSWDGAKIIFSMALGAPEQYALDRYVFQLYEATGLGPSDTPVITKVPNQPEGYNNVMPTYGTDDTVIFVSDKPHPAASHTYPQRDEYESTATNTGLWKLNRESGALEQLDHSPSGDFDPIIDSFGRIIFTRWDHLQRDQQNAGASYGAFNFTSEASNIVTTSTAEQFPEPRSIADRDFVPTINTHTMNQFFPWMISQSGEGLETLNHVGRHELSGYIPQSFNNDPSLEEYYGQYSRFNSATEIANFLHPHEDPTRRGLYIGVNAPEFASHSAGQLVSLSGAPSINPDEMALTYLTHPSTASLTDTPGPGHSGLYRDPLPLSDGTLLAVHTTSTQQDSNIGSRESPRSKYDFRIKHLNKSGQYYLPGTLLTPGIKKSVSFYDPDRLVSYTNVTMWELQPVELTARTPPIAWSPTLPAVESALIANAGVALAELKAFLVANNLALVVSRNLTSRDVADRQQPRNLRAGPTETRADNGKLYQVSHLQFFQGDLIRGYKDADGAVRPGRRVLAQAMHGVAANPVSNGPAGSVAIGDDGSMAAFVPAGRALTWQTIDPSGAPVVRERYWLTFKKGEIRSCGSCHGVNTIDQAGNPPPTNPPQALVTLLNYWRGLDHSEPLPTPTPVATATPSSSEYRIEVRSMSGTPLTTLPSRRPFVLALAGPFPGAQLNIRVMANGVACNGSVARVRLNRQGQRQITARLPDLIGRQTVQFIVARRGDTVVTSAAFTTESGTRGGIRRSLCAGIRVSL